MYEPWQNEKKSIGQADFIKVLSNFLYYNEASIAKDFIIILILLLLQLFAYWPCTFIAYMRKRVYPMITRITVYLNSCDLHQQTAELSKGVMRNSSKLMANWKKKKKEICRSTQFLLYHGINLYARHSLLKYINRWQPQQYNLKQIMETWSTLGVSDLIGVHKTNQNSTDVVVRRTHASYEIWHHHCFQPDIAGKKMATEHCKEYWRNII